MSEKKQKNNNIPTNKNFELFCRQLAQIIFFELEKNKDKKYGKSKYKED